MVGESGPDGRYRGPQDPALREEWRRERRTVLRLHHPDRGGEPGVLQRELDLLDRRFRAREGRPASPTTPPAAVVPPPLSVRVARQAGRAVRIAVRTAQARAPRGFPGRRRYHDL